MCTLPIVATAGGGYLLGHNRDESLARSPAEPPAVRTSGERSWMAPRDPEGGGSWIGVNDAGLTFALLNAAHADPSRLPSVPPTRGRLLTAVAPCGSAEAAGEALSRDGRLGQTRGFHLVVVEPGGAGREAAAVRFRWDGRSLERGRHPLPVLFVSSGYDQQAAEAARCRWWQRLLREIPDPGPGDLAAWLATHDPEPGLFSVCMHGRRAGTVSRTLVQVGGGRAVMDYQPGPPCTAREAGHRLEIPVRC